jgi:hypothetical protein
MCALVWLLPYDFNTVVLHHMAVMKYVSDCPKITLNAALVVDVKLWFPGLCAPLTTTGVIREEL